MPSLKQVTVTTMEFEKCPYLVVSQPKCFAQTSDHMPSQDEQSEYCKCSRYQLCTIYRHVPQWKKVVVEFSRVSVSGERNRVF